MRQEPTTPRARARRIATVLVVLAANGVTCGPAFEPWPDEGTWRYTPPDPLPIVDGEVIPLPVDVDAVDAANADVVDVPAAPGARWTALSLYDGAYSSWPSPSPSGDRIAFERGRPAVLSVETGAILHELVDGERCWAPTWDGEGRRIALWCHGPGEPDPRVSRDAPDHLAIWTLATGEVRQVAVASVGGRDLAWVAPAGAWWATSRASGTLGVWIRPDGTTRVEPLGAGDPSAPAADAAAPWRTRTAGATTAWSPDGRHGQRVVDAGLEADALAVPIAWRDGRLVVGTPWGLGAAGGTSVRVLDDGRVLAHVRVNGSVMAWRLFSSEGAPLAEAETADAVQAAVLAATGRCPIGAPAASGGLFDAGVASPDGRWTSGGGALLRVTDGTWTRLPVEVPVGNLFRVHAEVVAGVWLVSLRGTPSLLDVRAGRITWALPGARILAAEGRSALLESAGDVLAVDLVERTARRLSAADAHPVEGGAWLRSHDGTLRLVRADGRVLREVHVPFVDFVGPVQLRGRQRPVDDVHGWHLWRYADGQVVTYGGDPARVVALPEGVAPLGFDVTGGISCGTGYRTPGLGWLDGDGVHLLDQHGHQHRLAWADVRAESAPWGHGPPDAARVRAWMEGARGGTTEVYARGPRDHHRLPELELQVLEAGAERRLELTWRLPRAGEEVPSEPAEPLPGAPDLRTLDGDGWMLLRSDGSASGRDRLGAVERTVGGERTTPLHVGGAPWVPPGPVALGPCPWDRR